MRNWNPMICRSGSSWLYQSLSLLLPCCSKSHNGIAVECDIYSNPAVQNIWRKHLNEVNKFISHTSASLFCPLFMCLCICFRDSYFLPLYLGIHWCFFKSWWLLGYMLVYFSCFAIDFVSVFWMVSVWGCFLLAFHFGHHLSEIWSLKALASFSSSSVCL